MNYSRFNQVRIFVSPDELLSKKWPMKVIDRVGEGWWGRSCCTHNPRSTQQGFASRRASTISGVETYELRNLPISHSQSATEIHDAYIQFRASSSNVLACHPKSTLTTRNARMSFVRNRARCPCFGCRGAVRGRHGGHWLRGEH